MEKGGYEDDCVAEWLYTRTLLSFLKEGDSEGSRKELKTAIDSNKYVPEYLTGGKAVPELMPDMITIGGEDEGFCYAWKYKKMWGKVPGSIDWLKQIAGIKIISKVGRNDLCPCGSGKKYKKCCGGYL